MTTSYAEQIAVSAARLDKLPFAMADAFLEAADQHRPGARVIGYFRNDQRLLEDRSKPELMRAFSDLGAHVTATAQTVGEVPPQGEHFTYIEHVLEVSRLQEWTTAVLSPIFKHHYSQTADMIFRSLARAGIRLGEARRQQPQPTPDTAASAFGPRAKIRGMVEDLGIRRLNMLDIKGDTRKAMFNALEQGYREGFNPRKTARLMREIVPEGRFVNAGSAYRSELIARTETLHAQRMGSLEVYRAEPVIKRVVAFDGDSDEECAERDGEEFEFDAAEDEANNTHPNCVLAFGPVT